LEPGALLRGGIKLAARGLPGTSEETDTAKVIPGVIKENHRQR